MFVFIVGKLGRFYQLIFGSGFLGFSSTTFYTWLFVLLDFSVDLKTKSEFNHTGQCIRCRLGTEIGNYIFYSEYTVEITSIFINLIS